LDQLHATLLPSDEALAPRSPGKDKSSSDASVATVEDEFHNDDLIHKALKEFEATVIKTESPAE
jgi:hypothetical protein